jgi:GT2 family glycosyltransferase
MAAIISVIIPVHNSLAYTKDAIRLLKSALQWVKEPSWKFHVVVVDDGSGDGTSAWIKEHHPDIHLLQGDGKLWWSGAINKGMEFSTGELEADYILWWNNDIYPADDYFLNLTSIIGNATEPMVYGSKIFMAERPDRIWSYGGVFSRVWGHSKMPDTNKPDGPEYDSARKVDWLPGMGTLLPAEVIRKTGWLNAADFPQYHSDIDYTYRAKLLGYPIEVRPELHIWNHTFHSGRSHENKLGRLIPTLRDIKSIHNFKKEWLLYRKYARNPIAFFMLAKKYVGYFVKFAVRKE